MDVTLFAVELCLALFVLEGEAQIVGEACARCYFHLNKSISHHDPRKAFNVHASGYSPKIWIRSEHIFSKQPANVFANIPDNRTPYLRYFWNPLVKIQSCNPKPSYSRKL